LLLFVTTVIAFEPGAISTLAASNYDALGIGPDAFFGRPTFKLFP
jgi:hypothetical protein